jgi:hypothetical protein
MKTFISIDECPELKLTLSEIKFIKENASDDTIHPGELVDLLVQNWGLFGEMDQHLKDQIWYIWNNYSNKDVMFDV